MTIYTYNASAASVEDLMMQARKIKYDMVIGLTETRRHKLNTQPTAAEKNCSLENDTAGLRIGSLRLKRCGSMPTLTVFVEYAPTSDYDDEDVETFYVELEKFYKEDHTFYKVIIGDFNAKIEPRRSPEELHIGTQEIEWEGMGVKVDGWQLHHLRFADDILIISSTSQAERMLADFDRVCGNVGLQLNLTKTMLMRNRRVSDALFSLNRTPATCIWVAKSTWPTAGAGQEMLGGAFKSVGEAVKKTKNVRLRVHLFDSTVLPALTYASETCAIRKQDEHAISVAQRGIERTVLGVA
ncbi:unnamed protein product [Heligmosomoides polygyrus]|uniref:Reverse transcriptase domain-containing protein n=1 Tax=Heligmosomoides polygyrus TaxID=6339 RepID=A0A183G457_HELPZ|nr:unnamed protein product [Heligmosomoides polygyrus]